MKNLRSEKSAGLTTFDRSASEVLPKVVATRANVRFAISIFAAVLVGIAFRYSVVPTRAGTSGLLLWIAATYAFLSVVSLAFMLRDKAIRAWLRFVAGDVSVGFLAAAVLFGGGYLTTRIVAPASSPRQRWLASLYGLVGDRAVLLDHPWRVAAIIIFFVIAEELVWRGFVLRSALSRFGSVPAMGVSALLYALAHLPTIWTMSDPTIGLNPLLPFAALGAGLVWGWMANRFQRLMPVMIAHGLFDWAVLMLFPLWNG